MDPNDVEEYARSLREDDRTAGLIGLLTFVAMLAFLWQVVDCVGVTAGGVVKIMEKNRAQKDRECVKISLHEETGLPW